MSKMMKTRDNNFMSSDVRDALVSQQELFDAITALYQAMDKAAMLLERSEHVLNNTKNKTSRLIMRDTIKHCITSRNLADEAKDRAGESADQLAVVTHYLKSIVSPAQWDRGTRLFQAFKEEREAGSGARKKEGK